VIGVDPGRVNLGLGVFNRFTKKGRMMNIDYTVRPNPATGTMGRFKYKEKLVFEVVECIVRDFAEYFDNAYIVCCEKQMQGKGGRGGTSSREHIVFSSVLVAYLRGRGVRAIMVSAVTLRTFFGIRNGDYDENKAVCRSLAFDSYLVRAHSLTPHAALALGGGVPSIRRRAGHAQVQPQDRQGR
jgi:hypothetical protein